MLRSRRFLQIIVQIISRYLLNTEYGIEKMYSAVLRLLLISILGFFQSCLSSTQERNRDYSTTLKLNRELENHAFLINVSNEAMITGLRDSTCALNATPNYSKNIPLASDRL